MNQKKTYYSLGLMSGSSLDGLDIAWSKMTWELDRISDWELLSAETLPYSQMWRERLESLPTQSAEIYAKTEVYFSYYMAELVQTFMKKNGGNQIGFVSSHGHTVFHDPDKRFTSQIGNGGSLAAILEQTVISDFRVQDLAHSGEGAPLAIAADKYLFDGFDFFVNIGGIANISYLNPKSMIAFDFAAANQPLNRIAQEMGLEYDDRGIIASQGNLLPELFEKLSYLDFHQKKYPKSMSNQWIQKVFSPILLEHNASQPDKLHTLVHYIAEQLARALEQIKESVRILPLSPKILFSGGGVHHNFLMEVIKEKLKNQYETVIPHKEIINFKEALLMSVLGILRWEEQVNAFSSVTGAKKSSCNGAIYFAK